MMKVEGQCHCGDLRVNVELTQAPENYAPRACDCDFCVKHGAAYISDPAGRLQVVGENLKGYRQGSARAEFILCGRCGVLVGALYEDAAGLYAAANSQVLNARFAPKIEVSPRQLSPEEKVGRWKSVWFAHVELPTAKPSMNQPSPAALVALDVPPRTKPSNYPEPFARRMLGRVKRQLGDAFGLRKFGVNLTELAPGAESALLHRHSKQEEFIYILEGTPTLVLEGEEIALRPGLCAGFRPAERAHQLVNRSPTPVRYLEIGDREAGDEGTYPADDLMARLGANGAWIFTRKNGQPY